MNVKPFPIVASVPFENCQKKTLMESFFQNEVVKPRFLAAVYGRIDQLPFDLHGVGMRVWSVQAMLPTTSASLLLFGGDFDHPRRTRTACYLAEWNPEEGSGIVHIVDPSFRAWTPEIDKWMAGFLPHLRMVEQGLKELAKKT